MVLQPLKPESTTMTSTLNFCGVKNSSFCHYN